jgi:LPPG:FO 2-phospho-L-lactate transferase
MALTSSYDGRVVLLVGGVGGAKLAIGLAHWLRAEQLTIVVNVADDFWHYGLRICPDSDTLLYTLAGLVDPVNGWGLAGDTRQMLGAMARYGEPTWFGLGDQDLATHLLRTQLLRDGARLTEVTRHLADRLGIAHPLLPVSDDPVATIVDTVEHGELGFQTYFVRHRWTPTVRALRYDGIEAAAVTPEVRAAIAEADAIIIGPSNPWLSVQPMLDMPGMTALLTARDIPRVAVTPIIGGAAVKGPAAKIMEEMGLAVSSATVAAHYQPIINGFIDDVRDLAEWHIKGVKIAKLNTLMETTQDKINLGYSLLGWLKDWI